MQSLTETGDRIAAQRQPIRTEVTYALARLIVSGAIGPDEIISIAAAGRELGVSPTPVREALVELSQQGLVDVQPGRGFTVRPLHYEELRELYELINALEIVAFRLRPVISSSLRAHLEKLNDALRVSKAGFEALELDAGWHEALVSECDNTVLQDQLRSLRMRARRYEVRFLGDSQRVEQSAQQHDAILEALRAGRVEEALERLQNNWLGAIASAMPGLEEDPPRPIRGMVR